MHARDASSASSPLHRFAEKLALPVAGGVIHNVSSCLDDGALGTLRQVVGIAGNDDIVDLSGLPLSCSTITLTMGEIAIAQPLLTIKGPASRTLAITNGQVGRILHHSGSGELTVQNLTISNAEVYIPDGTARGGCILSAGSVFLDAATVSGCTAVAYAGSALGGAIYAGGRVTMAYSSVTSSGAYTYDAGTARGGGIYALYGLTALISTISSNFSATAGGYAGGGGASVRGANVELYATTIDANHSGYGAGVNWRSASKLFSAVDTTISGNIATTYAGAILAAPEGFGSTAQVHLYNSTIAFNASPKWGGVLAFASVVAYSSIIARNTSPLPFADLYVFGSLAGQNNLIIASNLGLATTLTADPQLTPLANHGGRTRTHALLPNSPAVDTGAMPPHEFVLIDQRQLARAVPAGKVDIGAYERQVNDDELFYSGFN